MRGRAGAWGAALAVGVLAALCVAGSRTFGADTSPGDSAGDLARYLAPAELERAHAFRMARYPLFAASMATRLAALAVLFALAPALVRGVRCTVRSLPSRVRETAAVALVVAAIRLGPWVAMLPPALAIDRVDRVAGLSRQTWAGWFGDQWLALAIDVLVAIAVARALLAIVRRVRRYWIPAGVAASLFLVAAVFLWPVTVEPLFNHFTPLPPGEVRDRAAALLERAGLAAGPMLVMDASRRGAWSNAYVTGLGKTQRVVLYDTLLERFKPAEVGAILAHEIGHRAHRHLILGAALAVPAMFAGLALASSLLRRLGFPGGPDTGLEFLVAFAFVIALLSATASPAVNAVSRRIEANADRYALALVDDPRDVVAAEIDLSRGNLSDPCPPAWARVLFFDHPPIADRVAMAERAVRNRR